MTTASLFPEQPLQVPPLGVALRPYQKAAVDAIYQWFEKKEGNPLVVVPTGGGKSVILAAFTHSVLAQWPGERILVLTHVKELIEQNHATMLRCWPGAPAGIYSAGLGRKEHDAPILFAGIQSAYRQASRIGWADLVLVDEAHLIPRDGFGMYRRFLSDLTSMNGQLRVIGLTATPFRTDSGSLEQGDDRLFHGIAYDCDLVQLIQNGWLSPVTSRGTKAPISTIGCRKQAGDYLVADLERAAMGQDLVPRAVSEIVARGQDRKAWLLFCCTVDHAVAVAAQLREHGIHAATVFGETAKGERDQGVADFKAGRLRAMVNVNVLTTGFDAPHVDLIALLRPTMSPGLYVQMVGRGLRRADGKADCLVLDFGGNVLRHGPIDRVKLKQPGQGAGGEAPAKECPQCMLLIAAGHQQCPECGHEFPPPQPQRHEAEPDENGTLVAGAPHPTGGIERWDVESTTYRRHEKRGNPLNENPFTLCAEYTCGWRKWVREWICFEHQGYARVKAERWWKERGGAAPVPTTVAEALQRQRELRPVTTVTVDVRGEYPELRSVRLGTAAAPEPDTEDGLTAEQWAAAWSWPTEIQRAFIGRRDELVAFNVDLAEATMQAFGETKDKAVAAKQAEASMASEVPF